MTTAVLCNLITLVAFYYVGQHPEAQRMAMLGELLLLGGVIVGLIHLLLLPLVYRVRRVPPPRGVVVFGACVAIGPMLVIAVRMLR